MNARQPSCAAVSRRRATAAVMSTCLDVLPGESSALHEDEGVLRRRTNARRVYTTCGRQDRVQPGVSRLRDALEVAVEEELEAADEGLRADGPGTVGDGSWRAEQNFGLVSKDPLVRQDELENGCFGLTAINVMLDIEDADLVGRRGCTAVEERQGAACVTL